VDWSKAPAGVNKAVVALKATAQGQAPSSFQVMVVANHTSVPSDFHGAICNFYQRGESAYPIKGFVEGDGAVSIEIAHASRNTSVDGVAWTELPGYGRTVSAVTPWPRTGAGEANHTAGTGASLEYDFYTFNTVDGQHVIVTAHLGTSLNAGGNDRPLALAMQVDGGVPVVSHYIPYAPATTLPAGWSGMDGWVANSVVPVSANFTAAPGKHTLKVRRRMTRKGVFTQLFLAGVDDRAGGSASEDRDKHRQSSKELPWPSRESTSINTECLR
jgi:hypothetical protein